MKVLIIKIKDLGASTLILRNLLMDILDKNDLNVLTVYDTIDDLTKTMCHFIKVELDEDENFDFIDFKIIELKNNVED